MSCKINKLQTSIFLVAVVIFITGITSSITIYLSAGDVTDNVSGYELEGSKQFVHDLELYGGKMNVLAVEFGQWFDGLWHGKSLAFTISSITILISLVLFFVAYQMPSDSKPYDRVGIDMEK